MVLGWISLVKVRKIFFFSKILRKKLLQLIDYKLFAEETFVDLGKKRKNCKTFFRKHFLPLK